MDNNYGNMNDTNNTNGTNNRDYTSNVKDDDVEQTYVLDDIF